MSLAFKKSLDTDYHIILLPVAKGQEYKRRVQELTLLEFVPDLVEKSKNVTTFHHTKDDVKVMILNLGDEKDLPQSYIYFRSVLVQIKNKDAIKVAILCDELNNDYLGNAVIGSVHSSIDYGSFKSDTDKKNIELDISVIDSQNRFNVFSEYRNIGEAQLLAMHLVDHPSNIKTPEYMAKAALDSGKNHGFTVKVMDVDEMEKIGMHALLTVGRGAEHPPKCIVMEYNLQAKNENKRTIGLVGKGISYDTGGLSIKTSAGMSLMKCDMAGAAAVIGLMEAVARLKWDIHVVAVVPAAENSVDALSYRPGDVIGSYSGKSIEVIDTDAEGRLVLADGLSYIIKEYNPDVLIDLATLTGSCVATLGSVAAGLFTQNDELAHDLSKAGVSVNEKMWRLPIWEDYNSYLQSDIADIRNLGNKPTAGAITAAKFLEYFTDEHPQWAHIDIAGVAFTDSEFAKSKTATAYGVRMLLEYIKVSK